MRFGWCGPRDYVLSKWLFAVYWTLPVRFIRVLRFYFDFTRMGK